MLTCKCGVNNTGVMHMVYTYVDGS